MRFKSKSEKEVQEEQFPVLSPGKYHFEVLESSEEVSKKGNAMIVLKLKILDNNFSPVAYLKDYLMESMSYKLRHAAYACGLSSYYDSGDLDANLFTSKSGTLKLVIQKDKTGQYPDRNSVQDYIKDEQQEQGNVSAKGEWGDIPF